MIDHFEMDRRALMQRVLMLAGATMLPGGTEALAAAAKGGKRALSPARLATVTALADTIVPKTDTGGALDAEVPAKLDALLAVWASPEHKAEVLAGIDKVDVEARAKQGKTFAALTPAERTAFLTPYDAAALKTAPAAPSAAPVPVTRQMSPRAVDPGYQRLKELIVVLYYISEVALTQELTYDHSPGEWQPSLPVTATTRQVGGIAPI